MRCLIALSCSLAAATAQLPERKLELTADAQAKLKANGFVVVDQLLPQGFSAYLDAEHPTFVTSDSLLMAYHRIFEELVGQVEAGQMASYRFFLRALWKGLPAEIGASASEARKVGHRRARLLTATAYRLLTGSDVEGLKPDESAEVLQEVARVEKGDGSIAPPWIIGKPGPTDGTNYRVFLPVGKFAGNETLERYYRCRKWLQEMGVDPAEESTGPMAESLGDALDPMAWEDTTFLRYPFSPGDTEPGLLSELVENRASHWLSDAMRELEKRPRWRLAPVLVPGGSKITQALFRQDPQPVAKTPAAVGFALGNPFATSLLDDDLRKLVSNAADFTIGNLYLNEASAAYFEALRALNTERDERAPALFRSEAWQRKQLNATLGSWTQYRYALMLGSREDFSTLSESIQETGFVEPVPVFYGLLGRSAECLAGMAGNASSKPARQAGFMIRLERAIAPLQAVHQAGEPGFGMRRPVSLEHTSMKEEFQGFFDESFPKGGDKERWDLDSSSDCGALAAKLISFTRAWWQGDAESTRLLDASETVGDRSQLQARFMKLAAVCYRLEALAERQLSGRPANGYDRAFLNDYGATLGWLMFYEGNSYRHPKDDAPQIVRYATLNDSGGATTALHAATSQPRLLLIRYPDPEGKERLCQGAVYAYRDIAAAVTPSEKEWQAQSEKSPWPEWMKPIVGSYTPPPKKDLE